jgi:hypothetical protein
LVGLVGDELHKHLRVNAVTQHLLHTDPAHSHGWQWRHGHTHTVPTLHFAVKRLPGTLLTAKFNSAECARPLLVGRFKGSPESFNPACQNEGKKEKNKNIKTLLAVGGQDSRERRHKGEEKRERETGQENVNGMATIGKKKGKPKKSKIPPRDTLTEQQVFPHVCVQRWHVLPYNFTATSADAAALAIRAEKRNRGSIRHSGHRRLRYVSVQLPVLDVFEDALLGHAACSIANVRGA